MTLKSSPLARCLPRQCPDWKWKAICGLSIDGYQRRTLIIILLFIGEMCKTDSVYHLLSSGESCTVSAQPNETLSLLCVHPPVQATPGATSTSGLASTPCHLRSVVWRRLETNGETRNVTETRRLSLRTGGGFGGGGLGEAGEEEGHGGRKVSLLRIIGLQPEDLSRYRCDLECADDQGRHFTRHHTVSVCIQQSHHQFAICESGAVVNGRCSRSFSDGVCDSYCDHESHLYDGFDCVRGGGGSGSVEPGAGGMTDGAGSSSADCRPEVDQKCRPSYADGICDHECDSAQCAWDGGDCIDRPLRLVDDVLVLTVAENFHRDPGHPLPRPLDPKTVSRTVSRLLRTVVRHPTDDWIASHLKDEHTHQGHGPPRSARERRGGGGAGSSSSWEADGVVMATGMRIYLKIDNTNCFRRCFDSAETAGKFIAMATRRGWDPGFRITSVAVLQRVTDRCRTLNDTYVIRSSAENGDVIEMSSGEWDVQHRLLGYSSWGAEESKGALVWVVIAAVVGGMCVVMLVFGLAVFAHRVSSMYHRRRQDLVGRGRSPPPTPEGGGQWAVHSRTTSAVGAEKFGTEV